MRVVIDSNGLQGDELRTFFEMSPNNRAVITDYTAMEAYKDNTLVSIQASWSVLRDFPDQILILEGTKAAGLVDPRAPGVANRLISREETKAVPSFIGALDRAAKGDAFIVRQLLERGRWARTQMNHILSGAADMNLSIDEFVGQFSKADLSRIRRKDRWTQDLALKFGDLVNRLALISFKRHPGRPVWPEPRHRINHFLYRHALAYAVYMLQLVRRGALNRKAQAARNDAVDVILATYATYFNGLMSEDNQASVIHHLTRFFLAEHGARVPEDYLEHYAIEIAARRDAAEHAKRGDS